MPTFLQRPPSFLFSYQKPFSFPLYVLHDTPISFSLIQSLKQYLESDSIKKVLTMRHVFIDMQVEDKNVITVCVTTLLRQ
jgi:hypothetical protein